MRILLSVIIALFSFFGEVLAADFPFVDVSVGSPYYNAVRSLYDHGVISDDGTHKFRPNDVLTRDTFVGVSMSVSCNPCKNPSIDDIARFQISPFPDIEKNNEYYYCIARANHDKIVQGYVLNENGQTTCQDGQTFSDVPYCKNNKITRIEAAILLLRQAKLWDDTLNIQYQKHISLSDVSDYWYGYAQKAIEAGILSPSGTGNIFPEEYLTRGEFAIMGSKMLDYNQCITPSSLNRVSSSIEIWGKNAKKLTQTPFSKETEFTLNSVIDTKTDYISSWKARESTTGKEVNYEGPSFSSNLLGVGNWYIGLSIYEKTLGEQVSTATITITVTDENGVDSNGASGTTIPGKNEGGTYPSLSLSASPLTPGVGGSVSFTTNSLGTMPVSYSWDLGDGSRSTTATGTMNHTYASPGVYTVIVTMTDAGGKSAGSSLVIEVSGKKDSDGDKIEDALDSCPLIRGGTSTKGCPNLETNLYTQGGFLLGNTTNNALNTPNILDTTMSELAAKSIVVDRNGIIVDQSTFTDTNLFYIIGNLEKQDGNNFSTIESTDYISSWKARESTTGKEVNYEGPSFLSNLLGVGNWYIGLSIYEKTLGEQVSTATITITVTDENGVDSNGASGTTIPGKNEGGTYPSLSLSASPLTPGVGGSVSFTTNSLGTMPVSYSWDLGDGSRSTTATGTMNHTYASPGVYTVIVTMTDAGGKSAKAATTIIVTEGTMGDSSTHPSSRSTPFASSPLSSVAPPLSISENGRIRVSVSLPPSSNTTIAASTTSAPISATTITDTDSDGIADTLDACPTIGGTTANGGCPLVGSFLGNVEQNSCVMDQIQKRGGIIIEPVCDICPCPTRISLGNSLRRCDIIFPAILSRDLRTIYSRGALYQIP